MTLKILNAVIGLGVKKIGKMNITDIKVYTLNLSAMTITTFDVLEDGLTLVLLIVSIGYTFQKWWEIRKKNKEKK